MRGGWLLAILMILSSGCRKTGNIPAVSGFELNRYLGKWYEISRLPNRFERDLTAVTAEYFLAPDGSCRVINRGYRQGKEKSVSGFVRFAGQPDSGELQVSFFRPFYGSYRIIKLAPDYRYSVVTSGSPDYLWILARKPYLSVQDAAEILAFLKKHGFQVNKLVPGQ